MGKRPDLPSCSVAGSFPLGLRAVPRQQPSREGVRNDARRHLGSHSPHDRIAKARAPIGQVGGSSVARAEVTVLTTTIAPCLRCSAVISTSGGRQRPLYWLLPTVGRLSRLQPAFAARRGLGSGRDARSGPGRARSVRPSPLAVLGPGPAGHRLFEDGWLGRADRFGARPTSP